MNSRNHFIVLFIVSVLITLGGLQFASGGWTETKAVLNQNLAMEVSASFDNTLTYVIAGGYLLMFVGMVLEGPMITAAASFASALGYFNIFAVFALAILGDLIADIAYYAMGHFSRSTVIERYGHRFGLSTGRMKKLEHLLKTHPKKTMVAIKLIPGMAALGLMMVGTTRMKIRKFSTICTLIILPKVLLFMFLGYYFGRTYDSISRYVQNGQYFIIFAIVAVLIAYYFYNKISALFARRLETI